MNEKNIEKGENKMQKFIAFALVLVLVLSLAVTSFAAKPSVSLSTAQKKVTVKRGKSVTYKYKLNCGSYKAKSGRYRAYFYSMVYCKAQPSYRADYPSLTSVFAFTGKGTKKVKFKFGKCAPTGKYIHKAVTGVINSNGSLGKGKVKSFKVTVK